MLEYIVTELTYNGKTLRVAVLMRDGRAELLRAETADAASRVGCIFKGTAERAAPNIDGVFVRVGQERMFLPGRVSAITGERVLISAPVVAQVKKDAAGRKEAVLTENVSVSGKYAVVFRKPGKLTWSKKLSKKQKELLGKWLVDADMSAHAVRIRTNAAWTEKRELLAEIRGLTEKMDNVLAGAERASSGKCVFRPAPFYETMLRDLAETPERCVTDLPAAAEKLTDILGEDGTRVELRERVGTGLLLAEEYNLSHLLDRLTQKVVWLKSGAFLVIEQTEAFVSVDVNTGHCTKGKIPEETFRNVNLEAAEELARQLSMRNLSGMILVDFISMENPDHREELVNVMKKHVRRDRVHTEVIDLTPLGIMEIVRQKQQKPLAEVLGV